MGKGRARMKKPQQLRKNWTGAVFFHNYCVKKKTCLSSGMKKGPGEKKSTAQSMIPTETVSRLLFPNDYDVRR